VWWIRLMRVLRKRSVRYGPGYFVRNDPRTCGPRTVVAMADPLADNEGVPAAAGHQSASRLGRIENGPEI
jgi:hypothetical protein